MNFIKVKDDLIRVIEILREIQGTKNINEPFLFENHLGYVIINIIILEIPTPKCENVMIYRLCVSDQSYSMRLHFIFISCSETIAWHQLTLRHSRWALTNHSDAWRILTQCSPQGCFVLKQWINLAQFQQVTVVAADL